jgi:hypothetical protein
MGRYRVARGHGFEQRAYQRSYPGAVAGAVLLGRMRVYSYA